MSDVTIRPMRADDLGAVAILHVRAFPGFFLSELGPGFLHQFYWGVLSDRSGIALVAEKDARIVGFVVGTTQPRGFYRRLVVRRSLSIIFAALPVIWRKPVTLLAMMQRILQRTGGRGQPAYGAELMSVAVDPAGQGKGAGAALVTAFAENARRAGAPGLWLLTDAVENDVVRAFYERLGFRNSREFVTFEGRRVSEYVQEF